ncbi:MAG: 3-dehydroquinate synthase [Clostridia bacterium]|nr:3-dehydroquinate synthase [Clostridia bacterium]
MNTLSVNLGERSYKIYIGKGILLDAEKVFDLEKKVFILTDRGVPKQYAEAVCGRAKQGMIFTVNEGEGSKSMTTLEAVLKAMLKFGMTRGDALVAVGGGVAGDLGGFAAATYMRGIDFYQVPTTVLAQVDSSIGGKCAVNLGGTKNVVGAFYQPKAVLIDTGTLDTLPRRLISAGLAESVKMALTSDRELFSIFENEDNIEYNIESIIIRSLMIKKRIVEADEKENGLRKILNFGHTLGHGIEAQMGMNGLYHGECVALGMLPVCSDDVRNRLEKVLEKLSLPVVCQCDIQEALEFVAHDKKRRGGMVDIILVNEIGECTIQSVTMDDFKKRVKERMRTI